MLPFSLQIQPGRPIADQVIYAVKKAVVSGRLQPGQAFPSVRVISQELKINPNTAHKVVATLVAEGVLITTPAVGSVVAEPSKADRADRAALLGADLERLVVEARQLGLVFALLAFRYLAKAPHVVATWTITCLLTVTTMAGSMAPQRDIILTEPDSRVLRRPEAAGALRWEVVSARVEKESPWPKLKIRVRVAGLRPDQLLEIGASCRIRLAGQLPDREFVEVRCDPLPRFQAWTEKLRPADTTMVELICSSPAIVSPIGDRPARFVVNFGGLLSQVKTAAVLVPGSTMSAGSDKIRLLDQRWSGGNRLSVLVLRSRAALYFADAPDTALQLLAIRPNGATAPLRRTALEVGRAPTMRLDLERLSLETETHYESTRLVGVVFGERSIFEHELTVDVPAEAADR